MRSTFLSIAFYLVTLAVAHSTAKGLALEVRPAGKELFGTKPKGIVAVTFRVTNTTSQQHEFTSEVELPEGWVLITQDFPFDLGGNETATKLVSFIVPETTPAGRYKITCLVKMRKYPSIRDFYTVDVVVLPYSSQAGKDEGRFRPIPPQIQPQQEIALKKNVEDNNPSSEGRPSPNLRFISGPKDAKELLETEPRQIVTTVFRVTNPTNKRREFITEVNLPEGWVPITKDFPFELNPAETDTKLVSFFVPQTTLAGRYEITYVIKDRKYRAIHDFYTVYVTVLPVGKLQVKSLEPPGYCIAGEEYQSSFVVTNLGNTEYTINTKINSGENIPYVVDADKFTLAPGQSKTATVTVKTDAKITTALKHRLRLAAEIVEDGKTKTKAQSESIMEIIPRISGAEQTYHTIPTDLTIRYVSDKNKDRQSGVQTDIRGEGTLDEEGKNHIKFEARGPDLQQKSVLGERDEYSLSYWTKDYEMHFGDRNYSLSSLTENYLYGRGLEGRVNLNDNFSAGAFHTQTRWRQPRIEETGASLDYLISQKEKIGLNYLRKQRDDTVSDITSIDTLLNPFDNTDLELEYALGPGGTTRDNAYLTRFYGNNDWLRYYLKLTHAGPDYPGYYKDLDFISGGVSLPLTKRLGLNTSFRRQKDNLALNPLLSSAPLEKHYEVGLDYELANNTRVSFDWLNRNREDRLEPPRFDYEENTFRLGLAHSFKKLTLYTSAEAGKTNNNLDDTKSKTERYTASAYFRPNDSQCYSGYLYYDDDSDFTGEDRRSTTIGLNAQYQIANRTSLNLMLQTNDYQGSTQGGRDNLELRLNHVFTNNNKLSILTRHTRYENSNSSDETALMVEWTIPLGLPVCRKKSVGSIKGYLYDQETQNAIGNAVLRLNGSTAVTDKAGNFTFPSVRPGIYYLNVDTASVGMNRIPTQKTPIELAVQGGEKTSVDIAVTRAAQLLGRIMVYGYRNNHSKMPTGEQPSDTNELYVVANCSSSNKDANLVEDHGLANTIIELKSSSEIRRTDTNDQGGFVFEELRPDKWTLKIYSDNLPEYHYLEQDTFELELSPGQREEISAKVLPKKRRIRMVSKAQTIIEQGK